MENSLRFVDIVEAADKLSLEEQETLAELLNRKILDRKRKMFYKDIERAKKDFEKGRFKVIKAADLEKEIYSR